MLSDEQKALRLTGVGASESAAALGLSPYQSRFNLYQLKRGECPPVEENILMRFGNAAEPFILGEFLRKHPDFSVQVAPPTMRRGRMLAHLDAWAPGRFNVQIKTARTRNGWGESGSPDVPQHYLLQVQHEMLLANVPVSFVPVFFGGSDYDEFVVEADRELQEMIEHGIAEFWSMVERGEPPEPTTYADMTDRWGRASRAGSVVATEDLLQAVADLRSLKEQDGQITEADEYLKAQIMKALGECDTLVDASGRPLVTWKAAKPRQGFDMDAFKAAYPEIHAAFTKEGQPSRRFVLKG